MFLFFSTFFFVNVRGCKIVLFYFFSKENKATIEWLVEIKSCVNIGSQHSATSFNTLASLFILSHLSKDCYAIPRVISTPSLNREFHLFSSPSTRQGQYIFFFFYFNGRRLRKGSKYLYRLRR